MADPIIREEDADPFRLVILKEMTACLQEITPANGYANDLSGDGKDHSKGVVSRGRLVYGDEEVLPLVSILEPPIPLEAILSRADNTNATGDWELLIQGFVADNPAHPSDPAHILMAEVKARLVREKKRDRGRNIFGLNGRVVELYIGQGSVRPADETSSRCFFWLTVTLKLAEDLEQPYQ